MNMISIQQRIIHKKSGDDHNNIHKSIGSFIRYARIHTQVCMQANLINLQAHKFYNLVCNFEALNCGCFVIFIYVPFVRY
jgi:hypothetical protein